MNPTKLSRRLAALLALCACAVQAEIMDDVEVRREGNNAVLMIRMTTPMTLVRSTVSRSKDLTQAYYRIKSTTERPQFVEGERRIVEVDGLPVVTIVDEPVRTDFLRDPNRRLVIAFSRAAKFKVRAGKGDRVLAWAPRSRPVLPVSLQPPRALCPQPMLLRSNLGLRHPISWILLSKPERVMRRLSWPLNSRSLNSLSPLLTRSWRWHRRP
jgi:hypothetical protein